MQAPKGNPGTGDARECIADIARRQYISSTIYHHARVPMRDNAFIIPASILAVGLIISVVVFGYVWSETRSAEQTITVTGSAKKDITSDLAILRGSISIEASTAAAAYGALKTQKPLLMQYLEAKGFPADKVDFYPVINTPVYSYGADGQQTGIRGYQYSQRVEIQSGDVQTIKAIALDISSIIEQGVFFNIEPPEYQYTKLANLKIQIQAEAAKDAMVRAERIATATGRSLGPLRTARMGVLQITPKNSNMVSDYGVNDVGSIEKEITAVVNASFQIK